MLVLNFDNCYVAEGYLSLLKSDPSVDVIILQEFTFQSFPAEVRMKMLPWATLEDDLLERF